jgi:hypothetical protein
VIKFERKHLKPSFEALFEDYCFSIAEIDFGQNWFSAKKNSH